MSLDGFVAGSSQSVKNPLGVGGCVCTVGRLAQWRAMHGLKAEGQQAPPVVAESSQHQPR
jgi:hypothetical protein